MRAMYSAVSGLRAHQVRMDVIGNNIANVNTPGYKEGRVRFQDLLSQSVGGGSQVGLGVTVGEIATEHGAGGLQFTGRASDLALEGPGFFVLKNGQDVLYTRVGSFDWDAGGNLVNAASGARAQGWGADATGQFGTRDASSLADVKIPTTDTSLARATTQAAFSRNLDAGAANGAVYDTSVTAYDTLGRPQTVPLRFTKAAANTWNVTYDNGGGYVALTTLVFNPDGSVLSGATATMTLNPAGASTLNIAANFTAITQSYNGTAGSDLAASEVDGQPYGNLLGVDMTTEGVVMGRYSNGVQRALAQVAVAAFPNPAGLQKAGATSYTATGAAGLAAVGPPGTGSFSRLSPGNLEMSNVDLATEFTNLILTERGFQSNTRVLTAADEMLQDVVNMRR